MSAPTEEPGSPTPFQTLGGEPALRAIIDDFVDRVFDDLMIGFHFARANRERIKKHEYEHAAVHLGAPGVVYQGRTMRQAHAAHRIMGGQFMRRREILRKVLVAHGVPEAIREGWLAYVDSLRGEITRDRGSECVGSAAEKS